MDWLVQKSLISHLMCLGISLYIKQLHIYLPIYALYFVSEPYEMKHQFSNQHFFAYANTPKKVHTEALICDKGSQTSHNFKGLKVKKVGNH